jgi:hypothetical protein
MVEIPLISVAAAVSIKKICLNAALVPPLPSRSATAMPASATRRSLRSKVRLSRFISDSPKLKKRQAILDQSSQVEYEIKHRQRRGQIPISPDPFGTDGKSPTKSQSQDLISLLRND